MTPVNSDLPCLVVDVGEYDEVWESAYVPALSAALGLEKNELRRLNLCDELFGSETLTAADLERVRFCPYVIIDTTSPSARVFFLLGYATAHRKRVVCVRHKDAHHRVDVADLRQRVYDSVNSLRDYLTRVVGYLHMQDGSLVGTQLKDFLARCGFPLIVLEGDGRYLYALPELSGERPIHVKLSPGIYVPPEPWRSEFARVFARQQEYAKSTGAVFFNGDLVRVRDFTPLRDERTGVRGLRIDAEPVDYFTFISSNHCWDFMGVAASTRLSAVESADLGDLRSSVLANPLTVSVSLIVRDSGTEWLVIQRRNREKNFHGKQDFICAAAGMVSATRDVRSGEIDVYATAANELREETGLQVREEQVTFLGLVRETGLREVGLLAEVAIDGDRSRIIGPRADAFESKGFLLCEATPEAFSEFLANNGPIERFAPLGLGAIVFSLLRRFSREHVENVFVARD